jgi:hypothetical protein
MFGQVSPLLGDLKISLLRTGIACSRRSSFGFFGSLPVFFRSFHADALWSLNEFRTPLTLNQDTGLGIRTVPAARYCPGQLQKLEIDKEILADQEPETKEAAN